MDWDGVLGDGRLNTGWIASRSRQQATATATEAAAVRQTAPRYDCGTQSGGHTMHRAAPYLAEYA